MKIYLAGPINACSDDEVTSWREQLKSSGLTYEFIDPADRDFRGVENETVDTIVEGDKFDILNADILVAYCWKPSYGTSMEILYAFDHDKRVFSVVPEPQPISPWVEYHSEAVFRTLDDVIQRLKLIWDNTSSELFQTQS